MDAQRFDALIRALAAHASRRAVLGGLAGGSAASLLARLRPLADIAAAAAPHPTAGAPLDMFVQNSIVPSNEAITERSRRRALFTAEIAGASTPKELAITAVTALTGQDFAALQRLYDPGSAPSGWSDVWPERTDGGPDFTGCAGISYSLGYWAREGACRPTDTSTDVMAIAYLASPWCGSLFRGGDSPSVMSIIMHLIRPSDRWFLIDSITFNANAPEFGQPCIDGSAPPPFPASFTGAWAGTGEQFAPAMSWPIAITFTGGEIDEVVGSVSYPSLGCESTLTLVDVFLPESFGGSVELTETITTGLGTCVSGGTFVIDGTAPGSDLSFRWSDPGGPSSARGTLTNVEANAPDPELLADIRRTAKLSDQRLAELVGSAKDGWKKGEYFKRAYPRDQAVAVVDSIVGLAGLTDVASAGKLLKLVRPGLVPTAQESLLAVARNGGFPLTEFLLRAATPAAASADAGARLLLTPALLLARHVGAAFVDELADAGASLAAGSVAEWLTGILSGASAHKQLYGLATALAKEHRAVLAAYSATITEQLAPDLASESFLVHLKRQRQANILIQQAVGYLTEPLVAAYDERIAGDADAIADFVARVLTVGAATLIAGPLGGTLAQGEWYVIDLIENKRKLDEDVRMAQAGIDAVWGAIHAMTRLFCNTYGGLSLLVDPDRQASGPAVPAGEVTVQDHYRRAGESVTELTIANRGDVPATYEITARYEQSGWFGWNFSTHLIQGNDVAQLDPGSSATIPVIYARKGRGAEPNRGSTVTFEVLGTTDTGVYFVDRVFGKWDP